MKEIYEKIKFNEVFENVLREVDGNTIVYILYNGEQFGITCGLGIQECTYYMEAMPAGFEAIDSILNAAQIVNIIDLQKENAIIEYRKNICEEDFEEFLMECIDNNKVHEIIDISSLGFFFDKKKNNIAFYDRLCDATFMEDNLNYIKGQDSMGRNTIMFLYNEPKKTDKIFKFEDDTLKVFTEDGCIQVTPKFRDGLPGIYVDLVSSRISEDNVGMTEYDVLPLSVTECYEWQKNNRYKTLIWETGQNESCTLSVNHHIIFKNN